MNLEQEEHARSHASNLDATAVWPDFLSDEESDAALTFAELEPDASMEAILVEYLAAHRRVSFVELEDRLPGFAGELAFRDRESPNRIFWQGVSAAAVHALHELLARNVIALEETSPKYYAAKGRQLLLSGGKSPRARRWVPVIVRLMD